MFDWVLNTPVQQNPDRIPFRIICNRLLTNITKNRYPDNCPPRKIAPQLGLWFGSRLGLVLGLRATRQLPPWKIAPG